MNAKTRKIALFIIVLAITATACRLPSLVVTDVAVEAADGSGGDLIVEPTAEAAVEESAASAEAEEIEPVATEEPVASEEPVSSEEPSEPEPTEPPATAEPPELGCSDRAAFVADVTIPDNTEITTGDVFTKTWRLRNEGTCTWTASYDLVYSHGDKMSGPNDLDLGGVVAPGNTVDISVELTAPGDAGAYQGFWLLRNNEGILFGLGEDANVAFWVKIQAVNPPADPPELPELPLPLPLPFPFPLPVFHTATLTTVPGESGSVSNVGSVSATKRAGDGFFNISTQMFLSFDISALPNNANISSVKVDFSDYAIVGNPFGSLQCLRGYVDEYGALDASDYHAGIALGAIMRFCNAGQLSAVEAVDDVKAALQSEVGGSRFRIRVYFNKHTSDMDMSSDAVTLGNPKLIVYYTLD